MGQRPVEGSMKKLLLQEEFIAVWMTCFQRLDFNCGKAGAEEGQIPDVLHAQPRGVVRCEQDESAVGGRIGLGLHHIDEIAPTSPEPRMDMCLVVLASF
ncbi:hypothetical protein SRHO_G00321370 [Serrasalmus rhombeus]